MLKNSENKISGAKISFLSTILISLVWLLRDLITDRELNETHTALMSILIICSLINRLSSRNFFKIKLARDGAEVEIKNI